MNDFVDQVMAKAYAQFLQMSNEEVQEWDFVKDGIPL